MSEESQGMIALPRYKCHKEVFALKIARVEQSPATLEFNGGSYRITPADEGHDWFDVPSEYFNKHNPQAGGYYVMYEDGYRSYSPAKAFEEGYTRI